MQTDPYEELERRRRQGLEGGGARYIEKIRATGRQTARERIDQLIDPDSWYELGMLAEPEFRRPDKVTTGDGVVTGLGRIDGRRVAIIAIDTTVLTGTTAPVNMRKQNRIAEWAGRRSMPLICLSDNDGGRLPDLLGWRFSGVPFDFGTFLQSPAGFPAIPHMTAVLGPAYGDAALHAAMGHFVVMRKDSAVALSGPPVIEAAIGEKVEADELGGPKVAHETSGAVHMVVDERDRGVRRDAPLPLLHARLGRAAGAGRAARRSGARPGRAGHARPARAAPRLRHAQGDRVHRRRRLAVPVGRALRAQPDHRLRAHRGQRRRRRRQPADAARGRARRAGADQARRLREALRHVQHPADVPAGRARA